MIEKTKPSVELVDSYTCYNLNHEPKNQDVIPKWIEKVMEPVKQSAPITDVTGIWP